MAATPPCALAVVLASIAGVAEALCRMKFHE